MNEDNAEAIILYLNNGERVQYEAQNYNSFDLVGDEHGVRVGLGRVHIFYPMRSISTYEVVFRSVK